MTGIEIITISNNVLLIALLFLFIFREADMAYKRTVVVGSLIGFFAIALLVLYVTGVVAQEAVPVNVPVVVVPAPTLADQIVPIAVAVATAIGIIMAAVLPAIAGIRKLIAEVKETQVKQTETVGKLEINTNSIREALVKATADGALAKGRLEGRAALKAENDAAAVMTGKMATPVEIMNADPVKVTETKT